MNFDFSKKIAILGFGIENKALLEWLIKRGTRDITICDKSQVLSSKLKTQNKFKITNIKLQTGENYLKNLDKFDIVFRTPGISILHSEIKKAKKAGVVISSQTKLFFDLCPAKILGITGTKGKGTTTSLIYEILKKNFKNKCKNQNVQNTKVYLGGNIGNAPTEFLDKLTKNDLVVLEMSSFQLHDLEKSPNIAVVLDIKSDHMDYHKNRREYINAKSNIVSHQTKKDFSVINLDYLTSYKFAALTRGEVYYFSRRKSVDLGAFIKGKEIILRTSKKDYVVCKIDKIKLRGEHNLENICAAITASYLAGAKIKSIQEAVLDFRGLEHRLELVKTIDKVSYYNDSFSTTPDTTIAAIKSFCEPIILLIGGSEKNSDYRELGKVIAETKNIKKIITIGLTAKRILAEVKKNTSKKIDVYNSKDIQDAVLDAKRNAAVGDVVLLSPASASFDKFKDYKDRGNQFKKYVIS